MGAMSRFPLLTLLAGLWLPALEGCAFPLVEHPQTKSGQEVRSLVGDGQSDRPVKVGLTTRAQIMSQLGEPDWRTGGDEELGYEYVVNATRWFDIFAVDARMHIFRLCRYPVSKAAVRVIL